MNVRAACLPLFAAALLTIGCDDRADQRQMSEQTPAVEQPAPPATGTMTAQGEVRQVEGSLQAVDLDAKTLTVRGDDMDHVFTFTDATEIRGASGAQGLSGKEGTRVTVHYQEGPTSRTATIIELNESHPS
jgi:hypothetical protein